MSSRDVEQGACRSLDELVRLAETRGYKNPRLWAEWVLEKRARRARARRDSTRFLPGRPYG